MLAKVNVSSEVASNPITTVTEQHQDFLATSFFFVAEVIFPG